LLINLRRKMVGLQAQLFDLTSAIDLQSEI